VEPVCTNQSDPQYQAVCTQVHSKWSTQVTNKLKWIDQDGFHHVPADPVVAMFERDGRYTGPKGVPPPPVSAEIQEFARLADEYRFRGHLGIHFRDDDGYDYWSE